MAICFIHIYQYSVFPSYKDSVYQYCTEGKVPFEAFYA